MIEMVFRPALCFYCKQFPNMKRLGWVLSAPVDMYGAWFIACKQHRRRSQKDETANRWHKVDAELFVVKCVLCLTPAGFTYENPHDGSWSFVCNDCFPKARELAETGSLSVHSDSMRAYLFDNTIRMAIEMKALPNEEALNRFSASLAAFINALTGAPTNIVPSGFAEDMWDSVEATRASRIALEYPQLLVHAILFTEGDYIEMVHYLFDNQTR